MLRFLYNLIFPLALAISLPAYLVRMVKRGNWRDGFGERFGRFAPDVLSRLNALPVADRTWIHAVSVGEVMLALKLIAALRDFQSQLPIILTTTTTTGHALAVQRVATDVVVLYAPLDIPSFVRRAFDAIRPRRVALIEAEVWPNWMASAQKRGVPVHLVNARLSPRSEARFLRLRRLVAPVFRQLASITVPEEADLSRWAAIGLPAEKLHCLGSIKFDGDAAAAPSPRDADFRALLTTAFPGVPGVEGQSLQANSAEPAPIPNPKSKTQNPKFLLGGSTHPEEELLLAKILLALRPRFPELYLLVAPRHVERTNEVAELLVALGVRVARRSLLDPKFNLLETPDVLLLDSTGELRDWYPMADVVFVGKSMASTVTGGQNPAEPIAAGVPAICGPHMENFADLMAALRSANGIIEVPDPARLQERIGWLLDHPEEGRALVGRGRAVLGRHSGAARRNAELLLAEDVESR